uniref:Uncharacterized protein n=1 Tax=Pyxicephalus adspersus TaxID=30357 RepID=A0AAV3B1U0_PYXAD|nr:TPA: hypothetical protein GDO54_007327 [Pyxicephalus adspersus]
MDPPSHKEKKKGYGCVSISPLCTDTIGFISCCSSTVQYISTTKSHVNGGKHFYFVTVLKLICSPHFTLKIPQNDEDDAFVVKMIFFKLCVRNLNGILEVIFEMPN